MGSPTPTEPSVFRAMSSHALPNVSSVERARAGRVSRTLALPRIWLAEMRVEMTLGIVATRVCQNPRVMERVTVTSLHA